jgi:hypothetical protein
MMSHAAGINISMSSNTKSIIELIEILLNNGWSVKDQGHISYLPLGDEDAFNWQHVVIPSWSKVVETLKQKEKNREMIGLVMTWKDANIGGEFLFFPDGRQLAISWSVNRRTLKHCADFTDHSWYLSRILTPLLKECIVIESVQCYDSV